MTRCVVIKVVIAQSMFKGKTEIGLNKGKYGYSEKVISCWRWNRSFFLSTLWVYRGLKIFAKTCSEKPIVIFWISCNKFICLNWSVVLVKEKLKTQQLLRKQSLKRNGYSWRKKAERREEPRKGFRENESNLRSLCRRLFFTITG